MLKSVREYARSGFFSYTLVAFLTIVFIFFFGVPTQWCGDRRGPGGSVKLAEIKGEAIEESDLTILYNSFIYTRALERMRKRQSGSGADQQQQNPQLQSDALKTMLVVELLSDKARQVGFRVGKDEFKEFMKDPQRNMDYRIVYGRNGTWNGARYKQYVQRRLLTKLETYENYKRKELLASKYLNMLEMQIGVLPSELKGMNELKNTEVNLEFVEFNPGALENSIELDPSAIEKYQAENADKIKEYYNNNKSKYQKPAEVQIRRVFIPKGTKEDSKKSVYESAVNRIFEQNESMKSVARDLSEDNSENAAGLMDWSTWDNLDQNIAEALKETDVGEPKKIETDYAYMIAQIEDKKAGQKTTLEEATPEIAKTLIREKSAKSMAGTLGKELQKRLEASQSLSKALGELKKSEKFGKYISDMKVKETGTFNLEADGPSGLGSRLAQLQMMGSSWKKVPKIGESQALKVDAFKTLSEDKPVAQKTYQVDKSHFVVKLKERTEPKAKALEANKQKWWNQLRKRKVTGILGRWAPGKWTRVFAMPNAKFGPWVEKLYEKAVENGQIKLFKKNHEAAKIASPSAVTMSPSQMKQLQKGGGGSKTIEINKGKRQKSGDKSQNNNKGKTKSN